MPETDQPQDQQTPEFTAAKAAVRAWLADLGGPFADLTPGEVSAYGGRQRPPAARIVSGWRLPLQFTDDVRRIDILLPVGFPWQAPTIALVDRPAHLTWPHVEPDGGLCLASNLTDIDSDAPEAVVFRLVGDAIILIEHLIAGELIEHFRDEFLSYWDHGAHHSGPGIVSLLRAAAPSRVVRLWRGKSACILADTDADLERFLSDRLGKRAGSYKIQDALFLWLGAPPLPSAYPQTGQALRQMATASGSENAKLLSELARTRPDSIIAALGFTTANGAAVAGVVVPEPRPPKYGPRDLLLKGFRKGTAPDALMLARYLGGRALMRRSVTRADPGWIHGRGQDELITQLRSKTVAVIGCGSVGAAIAVALAQSGIGNLILIDYDDLSWTNTSRHPLGAEYVGHPKSKALAEKLRSDFPHLNVAHYVCDVDTAAREHGDVLLGCDLIVCASGSWGADSRLDAWQEAIERRVPILYAWLEAHACAGHALLIQGAGASLRPGFDPTGLPHFSVTAWPEGLPLRREPACGAMYQPYGSAELGYVNALIAELALESLYGEVAGTSHRIWVGPRRRLIQSGGGWSTTWRNDQAFREAGGFMFDRPWPASITGSAQVIKAA